MYPVWEGVVVHSAMFIAIIASFHVLVSHFTVAASWFNLLVERRAYHDKNPGLLEYIKKSAYGLLVFSYVFGALAGVGIWFSTTAGSPRGISTLIHNFVLYWGAEWYFFLIDVVGITAYYYTLGRIDKKNHLRLAWILAFGGTGTLAVIVGILGFVLTPGHWLVSGQSLDGFYNPSFFPQIVMRFAVMFGVTSIWSIYVASRMPANSPNREDIVRIASVVGLSGFLIAFLVWRLWYLAILPDHARTVLASAAIPSITVPLIETTLGITVLFLIAAFANPRVVRTDLSIVVFIALFLGIFGAERVREVMRKPDMVAGYLSSNQLIFTGLRAREIPSETEPLNRSGVIGNLPYLMPSTQSDPHARELEEGHLLTVQECASCHSVSTQTEFRIGDRTIALRSLAALLAARGRHTPDEIAAYIAGIGSFPYMHAVVGNDHDRHAIATYLASFEAATVGKSPLAQLSASGGTTR